MSTKKPAPVAAGDRRSHQALELFERGMKALGKRDFERAGEHFTHLLSGFPEERDLVERARQYKTLCERSVQEAKRPVFKPKGFDDIVHHGVYLHNRGEFEDALRFLRQAAEMQPKNDHVLYCLAASAARAGDAPAALKALRSAVTISPTNRTLARGDADFDALREHEEFSAIVTAS